MKIVLAYSGGLDTSVMIKWLKETRFTKEYFEEKEFIPPEEEIGPKEILGEEKEEEVQE